ncbi:hypothetical protein [Halobellus sp. Atlit-38R]|uniref:hypothetical protein n=1 Tax=Halobellus sp. Atlit-38R TaxID=2282131 RepID=UPI0011C3FCE5|nr:hypothetical protein [Halobellus sp. Atlit-38R]
MNCPSCGTSRRYRSVLCFACVRAGVDPTAVAGVDSAVRDRLERYFVVSALRCADCGDPHETVTVGETSYTAADFGIDSPAEWVREMDKEEAWIAKHASAVDRALDALEREWPTAVAAVRDRRHPR